MKRQLMKGDVILDDFFAGNAGARSFRECYVEITGDKRVTGQWVNCDPVRLREAFGESYVEALTSASWSVALGDAIERRMQAQYDMLEELKAWRKVAVVTSPGNYRDHIGYRIGGYGNLQSVGEGAPYPALSSPDDEGAQYRVSKRGGTDSVTLEMVANDDTGAIRRIPSELALAAALTLYEFVFDFIRTNPVIYDGGALFSVAHGNLGTAALSLPSYFAGSMAIAKQVRPGSGKRVGFGRKTLLFPLDLQEKVDELFLKARASGVGSEILPDLLMVPYWTDPADWALVNDPVYSPTIEIGFLGGRELPEILVQDEQVAASVFSHDKLTYKIRHVYGGVPIGFQGSYKAVVV